MVKIYTRTGDDGSTGLLGSERVQKDSLRVEAFGALDECNAAIGVARAGLTERDIDKILEDVQSLLFSAGADLACPVETVEAFILPGGTSRSPHIHLSRSICRRGREI